MEIVGPGYAGNVRCSNVVAVVDVVDSVAVVDSVVAVVLGFEICFLDFGMVCVLESGIVCVYLVCIDFYGPLDASGFGSMIGLCFDDHTFGFDSF